MSYTVLARRYRSGTFDEIIGQDHVARTLKKAITSGRIAHAYLFCGTRGTGKTSTARILAKCLNCERAADGPTAEPCGQCNSCQGVARGEDMDVIEIDAASNTGVENVRDLISNSQYRPARSRFKVYIIDEVHMLSKSAFNALLKTLEEPPSHVKFILATTEAEKVLPTILSRCQRYDFRNIPTREIAAHLKNIVKQENVNADDDALLLVAKAGAGSMRDALSLLDRLLSIGEDRLSVETLEQLLGLPRSQLVFDLAGAIGAGDVKAVLGQADSVINDGLSPDALVAALIDHLRNLLILRTCGPDCDLVEVPGLSAKDLQQQAERFGPVALTQDITILEELRRHMRQSQGGRALLDATLVRMALSDQFTAISELLGRLDGDGPHASPRASRPAGAGVAPRQPAQSPAQKKNDLTGRASWVAVQSSATPAPVMSAPATSAPATSAPDDGARRPAPRGDARPVDPPPPAIVPSRQEAAQLASAQASASASASASPSPSPALPTDDGDGDDALPQPGRVWDPSGPSLIDELKRYHADDLNVPGDETPNVGAVLDLPTFWRALLAELGKAGPGIPSLLGHGRLEELNAERIVIRYGAQHETLRRMLERNGKMEAVRQVASTLAGRPLALVIEVDAAQAGPPSARAGSPGPVPPRRLVPTRAPGPELSLAPAAPNGQPVSPEMAEELKANSPLVKALVERLGAVPFRMID